MRSLIRLALAAPLVLGLLVTASSWAGASSAWQLPSSTTITEVAGNHFTFTHQRLQAGLINFTLVNTLAATGKGELQLFRMKGDTPVVQFRLHLAQIFSTNPKVAAAGIRWARAHVLALGGNGFTASMEQDSVLSAGTYYVADTTAWLVSSGKTGLGTFTVRGDGTGSLPQVGQQITAADTGPMGMPRFHPTSPLHFGWVRIDNDSADLHMYFIVRVQAHTTNKQLIAALLQGVNNGQITGPPVGSDVISPGTDSNITIAGQPGRYAITCLVPDPETGLPHILMGMTSFVQIN